MVLPGLQALANILATKEQTGGSYSLMEELCPRWSGPPPHTHEQDEVFYIFDGEITLIASDVRQTAKGGCVHTFRVDSETVLNFYFSADSNGSSLSSAHPPNPAQFPHRSCANPALLSR
jgi:uncharacterized cupin superfamily protein